MLQLTQYRNLLFLLPIAIIVACTLVTNSEIFILETSLLSKAITFDLLITTPILYYLVIRKRSIPKTTIVPVFMLGIVVASLILPKAHQDYLHMVKEWFLPFMELGVLAYLFFTTRKAIRIAKTKKEASLDFHDVAKMVASDLFSPGVVGTVIATEVSMIYYGLISWKKYQKKENEFTYHQSTSTRMLLGVFIFLIIVETVALHLALQNLSTTAAWMLTLITGYTALQMLAIAKSISRRPIVLDDEKLKLRWGFMHESEILLENITSIELDKTETEKVPEIHFLSPFQSAEGHNVKIALKEENTLSKLYGFTSTYHKIFIYLDDPESFIDSIKQRENSIVSED